MAEIRILKEVANPLLKRVEIVFEIPHSRGKTPTVAEAREAVSALKKTPIEAVYIRSLKGVSGRQSSIGEAHVYFSPEHAKIEPMHVRVANLPPEEKKRRKEELKKMRMEMKAKATGGKK
ncbi:MAG: 30S ribosomal protein S24e [Thermoproteota archaeon]|nr:30S ribosomal protein S24e [Candidatus Brockarchaeota archaeon]